MNSICSNSSRERGGSEPATDVVCATAWKLLLASMGGLGRLHLLYSKWPPYCFSALLDDDACEGMKTHLKNGWESLMTLEAQCLENANGMEARNHHKNYTFKQINK